VCAYNGALVIRYTALFMGCRHFLCVCECVNVCVCMCVSVCVSVCAIMGLLSSDIQMGEGVRIFELRYKAHITGWRRLIGSIKLHIIFHKRATKYMSLLRKMTYKDKGSYESSPPCIVIPSAARRHPYASMIQRHPYAYIPALVCANSHILLFLSDPTLVLSSSLPLLKDTHTHHASFEKIQGFLAEKLGSFDNHNTTQ